MMKEETYICECGKSFDKIRGMTEHQSHCKENKKILNDKKKLNDFQMECSSARIQIVEKSMMVLMDLEDFAL